MPIDGVAVSRVSAILLIITLFTVFVLLTNMGTVYVSSQTAVNSFWETLGGDPYRRSFIPLSVMNGALNGVRKWYFDPPANDPALGYYPIDMNPLIVNIDGAGSNEIVVVNSGGVLMVLSGVDGSLLGYIVVNGEPHSTPSAADLDGDGLLEVILGTKDGRVVAVDIDQTWSMSLLWRSERLDERISTSPLVVDLDGATGYEVVVQTRGGLICLNGTDGSVRWKSRARNMVMVQSPSLLDDINGDGVLDIIGSGFLGLLYAVSGRDGTILWQTNLWRIDPVLDKMFIVHTPVVTDVDGDGAQEVLVSLGREVFGRVSTAEGTTVVTRTGFVGALAIVDAADGQVEAIVTSSNPVLYAWFAQPAVAVGDIDSDGVDEVVLAGADGNVTLLDYTGSNYVVTTLFTYDTYWTNPANGPMGPNSASVVIADIDGDTSYEAIILSTGDSRGRLSYLVYIYDFDTSTYTQIYNVYRDLTTTYRRFNWPSLSLGDVDGDQSLEAVIVAYRLVICLE